MSKSANGKSTCYRPFGNNHFISRSRKRKNVLQQINGFDSKWGFLIAKVCIVGRPGFDLKTFDCKNCVDSKETILN